MSEGKTDTAEGSERYEDEFSWGDPEQERSSNFNKLQHYKSFFYSGDEYLLYDYVYLNSGDDDAPFIGKIMRLWEVKACKSKKVRVRWLYRPSDIPEEITDVDRSSNNKELFMSFGQKDGVDNVNDLVVVCGKCKILCTATDKRNEQPSESQLAEAHHFFYRSFDVDEQELYPDLDKVVKELGARKVFNNARATPQKIATSSDEGQNDKSNKLELKTMVAPVNQQNTGARRRKRLQKKALDCGSCSLEMFVDDSQESVGAAGAPQDLSEKDSDVVNAEKTDIEHGLNDSATITLPVDTDKFSLSVDVKANFSSEVKECPTPKLPTEIKSTKRHLDAVIAVPKKKMKTLVKEFNDSDGTKKAVVVSNIGKASKNLEKPTASSNLDTPGDISKKLQNTTVKNEPQVPVKGIDAVSIKKVKTEDQKVGEKGTGIKSADDADNKRGTSNVGIKKTNIVTSKLSGGKVTSDSAKLQVNSVSDPKDNTSQTLSKTLQKKRLEISSEGVESVVVKQNKPDEQKRSDERTFSRFTTMSQTRPGSEIQVSEVTRNEVNGQKSADKTPKEKSSEYSILKKPNTADFMPCIGTKSPPGSDSSFKSLLDRDRAKNMMLDAKAKSLESKVLAASERRRIFREPTPEEKLEKGFKDGMIIHLKNFDASLTKGELEGALKSLIPRFEVVMLSQKDLPHVFPSTRGDTVLDSGQALLVFRDKGQGDVALRFLQETCVVLADDGRPLLAIEAEQRVTGKSTKFIGHINLDKFKSLRKHESEGMRNAVATSHCSQPNTIEYEMAIQWRVLDEQEQMQWEQLHKKQEEAVKLLLRKHT